MRARRSVSERFWEKVDKSAGPDGCWEWKASHNNNGYGKMAVGFKCDGTFRLESSHRLSYQMHHGPIPDGMLVCHRCDNPICVNPDHLFLGSYTDNVRDMIEKRRNLRGESHRWAILNEQNVRDIRRMYATGEFTHRQLSSIFGIGLSTTGEIVRRERWRHVE